MRQNFIMGFKNAFKNHLTTVADGIHETFLIVLTQKLSLTLKWQKQPLDGTKQSTFKVHSELTATTYSLSMVHIL